MIENGDLFKKASFIFFKYSKKSRFRFKLNGTSHFSLLFHVLFKVHFFYYATEPVYRQAEQEWKCFIEAFTDVLAEVDPQIPHLPPKDVIHRIYRDVRDLSFCP